MLRITNIRGMQIKTIMKYLTFVRMVIFQDNKKQLLVRIWSKGNPVGGNANLYIHYGKQHENSSNI